MGVYCNMKKQSLNMQRINKAIIIGFVFFSMLAYASALSIGSISDRVELYPGQVFDKDVTIQNVLDGAVDVAFEGDVEVGSDIVSIVGNKIINVPAKSTVSIPLKFTIPSNAQIGQEYPIRLMFKSTAGAKGDGSVAMAMDLGKEFKIVVVEKPVVADTNTATTVSQETGFFGSVWVWLLIIVVIVVIVWLVVKKKK